MSHAYGQVFSKEDELLGWFEYNGTSDFALTAIQKTKEEVSNLWRTNSAHRECVCEDYEMEPDVVDVNLYSSYGGGFYWPSKICKRCMAIIDNTTPHHFRSGFAFGYDDSDERDKEYWPTDGHPLFGEFSASSYEEQNDYFKKIFDLTVKE